MTQAISQLMQRAPLAPNSTRRYLAQRYLNGEWTNIGTHATHSEAFALAGLFSGTRIVAELTGGKFILIK